ncbi:hypothetical protein B566_EDAN006535 [Ephemera danica]|nr:hypothetical protein B566_EDAN006535 [Ephemera danica]
MEVILFTETASPDSLKHKKSELRLYCDLLMQQAHMVKESACKEKPPDLQKLEEATTLLSATCDSFIETLEACTKLANENFQFELPMQHSDAVIPPSLAKSNKVFNVYYERAENSWQTRWFVLNDGILTYYNSKDEVGQGCKGSLKVSACEISVHPVDCSRMDIVIPGEQHLYLKASSAPERQRWLVALGSSKACVNTSRPRRNSGTSRMHVNEQASSSQFVCQ